MRVALDTNILVYRSSFGISDKDMLKGRSAAALIARIAGRHTIIIPGQVLGELYNVLTKRGIAREEARSIVRAFASVNPVVPAAATTYAAALDLAVDRKLQFWDALIVAASIEAECGLLLTEDMQDGPTLGGVTIVNPFAASPHPLLASLLGD